MVGQLRARTPVTVCVTTSCEVPPGPKNSLVTTLFEVYGVLAGHRRLCGGAAPLTRIALQRVNGVPLDGCEQDLPASDKNEKEVLEGMHDRKGLNLSANAKWSIPKFIN